MTGRLLILIAGAFLFWGAAAPAVRRLGGGEWTLVYAGVAMLLCLVPAVVTLLWADWAQRRDPAQVPLVILGATGVRMFAVLTVGFLLVQTVPLFREQEGFLIWLLVFYLFTLALEMSLLLKGRSRPDSPA